jgi:hypothetical protein
MIFSPMADVLWPSTAQPWSLEGETEFPSGIPSYAAGIRSKLKSSFFCLSVCARTPSERADAHLAVLFSPIAYEEGSCTCGTANDIAKEIIAPLYFCGAEMA